MDGSAVGTFDVDAVSEASGLAVSRRDAGLVWVLDDGPGTSAVHAVRVDGRPAPAGRVEIAGFNGVDTESLASGPCAAGSDEPCLFVGDVGDNRRSRAEISVLRLVEPDLSSGLPRGPVDADNLPLVYPDEPHDAEAILAVDGRILVVTKAPFDADTATTGATRLYEAPSQQGAAVAGTLRDRGELELPPPAAALLSNAVGGGVTGGEALEGLVVLRSYDHAVRFQAARVGDDVATLGDWPAQEIRSVGHLQTEGIAVDADGCRTYTVGEGSGAVLATPCE